MFIGRLLILASATTLKIRTPRLNAMRRRLQHAFEPRARKPWLLLSKCSFDLLALKHKWHEEGFAWTAGIGWEASEPISAINKLFDFQLH